MQSGLKFLSYVEVVTNALMSWISGPARDLDALGNSTLQKLRDMTQQRYSWEIAVIVDGSEGFGKDIVGHAHR